MKKTTLNSAHHKLGGKMIEFVGWELPVQYSGVSEEHMAVRTTGGFFDVSHMGEVYFRGPQALAAVQHITSNNAAKLTPGKIQYSGLMTSRGTFVDDLLVYMMSETEYMLVVNAANREKDVAYMKQTCQGFDVTITDESDEITQIAIQGPQAENLLAQFTKTDLSPIVYYSFVMGQVDGIDSIISRTGYTGEDGFEIYFRATPETASALLLKLVEAGKALGMIPAGLGARDSLRLEASMCLYGNDIDDQHTVLEAGLGWILKLQKGDFVAREALEKQKAEGLTRKLVGFEMIDRGIARHGYPVFIGDKQVGDVTSGTQTPYLKKAIGMAYLPIEHSEPGQRFDVEIRGKKVAAQVIPMPFYKRAK